MGQKDLEILPLKETLMRRDKLSAEEAQDLINEAKADLMVRIDKDEYIDDQDFMEEWFGLEPDYFLELMPV